MGHYVSEIEHSKPDPIIDHNDPRHEENKSLRNAITFELVLMSYKDLKQVHKYIKNLTKK